MANVRLFLAPRYSNRDDIRLIDPMQEAAKKRGKVLFKDLPPDFAYTTFDVTNDIDLADFVLVPQSIRRVDDAALRYLKTTLADAATRGKKVIAFLAGDHCYRYHIDLPDLIVFKSSDYRHAVHANEIVFAPFVGDLAAESPLAIRTKAEKPIVSFCGYAGFPSLKSRLRYIVTNAALDIRTAVTRSSIPQAYKRGIYFRRKAIKFLEKDERVITKFIVRGSFSGNADTAVSDPYTLRREFIESIADADFVLAPRGDGNFSARFYEILSLGRIPVLIDTDMVLPFEHLIDYDKFIIRVPHDQLERVGDYIVERFNSLTNDSYREMQVEARRAFQEYLRYDAYFNTALPLLKEGGISAVVGE